MHRGTKRNRIADDDGQIRRDLAMHGDLAGTDQRKGTVDGGLDDFRGRQRDARRRVET